MGCIGEMFGGRRVSGPKGSGMIRNYGPQRQSHIIVNV